MAGLWATCFEDRMYRLFLDDERHPVDEERYVIARSSNEAVQLLLERGLPIEICFDHDLGDDDTAMIYVYTMCAYMQDRGLRFPAGFSYSIHSQNPVGRERIASFMESAFTHIGREG